VGLGTITLDTVLVAPNRSLRVGGSSTCDLPFTCDPADLVERVDGAWVVRVPDGVDRDGPGNGRGDRTIRLCDWDAGVTLRGEGEAWLRLWPTRPERFAGRDPLQGPRWLVARALPVLWLALSVTLGLATFGMWASTTVRGDPRVLALGDGALGQGGDLERVASLGDGEQAAGVNFGAWMSRPTPPAPVPEDAADEEDASVDEAPAAPEQPEAAAEETAPESAPEPQDDGDASAVQPPVETPESAPADTTPEETTDADTGARVDDGSPQATGDGDASATGDDRGVKGRKSGGAGGFGAGGGTDDGYADRVDSVNALERSLLGCLEGEETHRINLMVGLDGKAESRSVDFFQGTWSRGERSCVNDTIAEWAFPSGEESYEVDLRMRKGSRRHRGA